MATLLRRSVPLTILILLVAVVSRGQEVADDVPAAVTNVAAPNATVPAAKPGVPPVVLDDEASAAIPPAETAPAAGGAGWRSPAGRTASEPASGVAAPLREVKSPERRTVARVSKGSGSLPNDHGQIWREYDISPYTARVAGADRPEQAIVDWILRETGYEAWHSEPLGILSAGKKILRCYHTPEMQAIVADIVDRFVSSEAETQAFGLRIATVENPNWRAKSVRLLKPVPVQSPGVQAWLLAKEDAAVLLAELSKRSDYREHGSPHMLVHNGQGVKVSTLRPVSYVRDVVLNEGQWPGYSPQNGQVEEGYSMEFSPLLSLDGRTVDAVIKLRLNQVEKMIPVMVGVPSAVAPRQRAQVEVPQMTANNLQERFRWPTDQVLLLSLGVVATPVPTTGNPLTAALPLPKSPGRADALLFVEARGKVALPPPGTAPAGREASRFPKRY